MDRDQRNQLFIELRNKELKLKNLAQRVGCSASMLSKYFSNKANLSLEKEEKLINEIHNAKEYRLIRVQVE